MDKRIHIKCAGGRQGTPFPLISSVCGTLKGFDQLTNLVLDDAVEYLRGLWLSNLADPRNECQVTERCRKLGLIVCRGTAINLIHPEHGFEEIENPFNLEE